MTSKVLVLSDLHLEFHADGGETFVQSLRSDVDAVLLAGDVATLSGLRKALTLFNNKFNRVLMVTGNHEFYGSYREVVVSELREIQADLPKFQYLDNSSTQLGETRIVASTLWFEEHKRAPKHLMNDFKLIRDFSSWVYKENEKAKEYLRSSVRPGDLVMTHYLPSYKSVAPEYVGSELNPFFVCDVEEIMLGRRPSFWIHGHTHSSADYQYEDTRVICNPLGYIGYEVNPKFKIDLVIEVP